MTTTATVCCFLASGLRRSGLSRRWQSGGCAVGNKFGAKREGKYASRRESRRAQELVLLQRIGEISDLEEQVKFELIPKQEGERAVTYTADFRYRENGQTVVEDSKGMKTQQYIIRRKLMLWIHGIRILETK